MLGRRGKHALAIAAAGGLVLSTAPPAAAAPTFTFEDGVLEVQGSPLQPRCSFSEIELVASPTVATGIACTDVELVRLVFPSDGGTAYIGDLPPASMAPGTAIELVGSAAGQSINMTALDPMLPVLGDLGGGNDTFFGGIGDVDLALGPGNDSYGAMLDGALGTVQEVDCGPGVDSTAVRVVRFDDLVVHPTTIGWDVWDDAGTSGAGARLSNCEVHDVAHYLAPINNAIATVVGSVRHGLQYLAPFALPEVVFVDLRGQDFDAHVESTLFSLTATGLGTLTFRGSGLIDRTFLYNGRAYQLIDAVYDLFLGRAPDDGGFWFWEEELWNGRSRQSFVATLQRLPEHAGLSVDLAYDRILHRTPDPGGRTFWAGRVQAGTTLDGLRAQLYGSPEYFARAGSTTNGFLNAVYSDVLGRTIDPGGQTYWAGRLANGETRTQIAAAMLGLREPVGVAIARTYQRLLGRTPGPTEIDGWRTLWATQGEFTLAATLAGSTEFYQRVAPLDPTVEPAYTPTWSAPVTAAAATAHPVEG